MRKLSQSTKCSKQCLMKNFAVQVYIGKNNNNKEKSSYRKAYFLCEEKRN